MKRHFLSLIVLFVSGVILISCNTVEIVSSTRTLVYPGVATAKTTMNYEVVFKSNSDFSINTVLLNNDTIKSYFIQNVQTQVFEDVKKNSFNAGEFKLTFKSLKLYKPGENNKIAIDILVKGKRKVIKIDAIDGKPVHRR
jgi:hypothetical protein